MVSPPTGTFSDAQGFKVTITMRGANYVTSWITNATADGATFSVARVRVTDIKGPNLYPSIRPVQPDPESYGVASTFNASRLDGATTAATPITRLTFCYVPPPPRRRRQHRRQHRLRRQPDANADSDQDPDAHSDANKSSDTNTSGDAARGVSDPHGRTHRRLAKRVAKRLSRPQCRPLSRPR